MVLGLMPVSSMDADVAGTFELFGRSSQLAHCERKLKSGDGDIAAFF